MEQAPWRSIPALIDDAARRFPDTEGLADDEVSWTFPQLTAAIHSAARALIASGVHPGDRVGIWAPNIREWVVAGLAVHSVGGVLVPVNTRFRAAEAAYVLDKASVRLLFTVTDFLETDYVAMLAGHEPSSLERTVVLRGAAPAGTTAFDDFLEEGAGVDDATRATRAAAVGEFDLCHILFTSGTTGAPKGVMLEHGQICDVYLALAKVFELGHGDRQLVVLPFFHSFGLHVGILCGFMVGATILPHLVFDIDVVLDRLVDDRVTSFPGPPSVFQAMIASPRLPDVDLSALRSITLGGASVPPSLVRALNDLGVERVQAGYGLTESSGTVSLSGPPDSPEVIATTVGRPLPGTQVRIVDGDGIEVATGETGEVLFKGPSVMRGYLDDPEQTAEVIDADGWLHTGDVGHLQDDGNLVLTDRLKDMYTVGGFNAYPAEIEAMLAAHPDIAQSAVIGTPDDRLGEVGMAFIVATPGSAPEPESIIAWCREAMANYKVPRQVEVVDALPMNATGKVLKGELRARAAR